MGTVWKLAQANIPRLLHRGITVLSCRNPLISNIVPRISSTRQIVSLPKITHKLQEKLQTIDKVPKDCILIYKSSVCEFVMFAHYGSLLFIIVAFAQFGYLYLNFEDLKPKMDQGQEVNWQAFLDENETLILLAGLFVTNMYLFFWSRAHALRIWFNPKTNQYTLNYRGLPGKIKNLVFEPGAAKLKRKKPRTAFGRASHIIHGKTFYFTETNFRTPADYEKMTGGVTSQ